MLLAESVAMNRVFTEVSTDLRPVVVKTAATGFHVEPAARLFQATAATVMGLPQQPLGFFRRRMPSLIFLPTGHLNRLSRSYAFPQKETKTQRHGDMHAAGPAVVATVDDG